LAYSPAARAHQHMALQCIELQLDWASIMRASMTWTQSWACICIA